MASPRLFFSPNTPCYAVIRMDPVAMVRKLDDPEAMAAARGMTPQSYVVFLSNVSLMSTLLTLLCSNPFSLTGIGTPIPK